MSLPLAFHAACRSRPTRRAERNVTRRVFSPALQPAADGKLVRDEHVLGRPQNLAVQDDLGQRVQAVEVQERAGRGGPSTVKVVS